MPTDRRELAYAAFHAALQGLAPSPAAKVLRQSDWTFDAVSDLPAIVQIDRGEVIADGLTGVVLIDSAVHVDVLIQAQQLDQIGPLLNDFRGRILAALMADVTLGGTATNVRYESAGPVDVVGDGSGLAAMTLRFTIQRTESEADPYSAG